MSWGRVGERLGKGWGRVGERLSKRQKSCFSSALPDDFTQERKSQFAASGRSWKWQELEVAGIMDCCEVVLNTWQKRFEQEGLQGLLTRRLLTRRLLTRPGRGRRPLWSQQNPEHLRRVREEIKRKSSRSQFGQDRSGRS